MHEVSRPIKRSKPNWWSQQSWLSKVFEVRQYFQKRLNREVANKQAALVLNCSAANKKNCAPLTRMIQFWQLFDLRDSFKIRWARHSTPRFVFIGTVRFKYDGKKSEDRGFIFKSSTWVQSSDTFWFSVNSYRTGCHFLHKRHSEKVPAPSCIIRLANHWLTS